MESPVTIYVVHHPDCELAAELASSLFDWFRLGYLGSDSNDVGVPIYFRRSLCPDQKEIAPKIAWDEADNTVLIVLVDHKMVLCPNWRSAMEALAEKVHQDQSDTKKKRKCTLLPVVIHDSFYRTDKLYKHFNSSTSKTLEVRDETNGTASSYRDNCQGNSKREKRRFPDAAESIPQPRQTRWNRNCRGDQGWDQAV